MKVSFIAPDIGAGFASSVSVIPAFKGAVLGAAAKAYDGGANGQIAAAAKAAGLSGENGKRADINGANGTKTPLISLLEAGDKTGFDAETFGAKAAKSLLMCGQKTLVLHLDGLDLTPVEAARAALGAQLATYRFDKYRTKLPESKKPSLTAVKIAVENPDKARDAYKYFYGPVAEGTMLARDLVSEPPNVLFPKAYAARIKKMDSLGLKIEVLDEKKMESLGMHALLGVGKGSERDSQLVIMKWAGGKADENPVCLVGKGVTFDSGGISLKPGNGMWDMKGDMGGSAAVVGAMHTIAARKAKANVIGIVGLVENMPDGKAQNPGDIVTSMSGQTIEVQNTDAEGRLVLCDALHYAITKYKPKAVVNLATLTGAIITALGHEHAGLFSNSDDVSEQLTAAAETSGEKVWRFPLHKEYDQLLDSKYADMKNIGGPKAGSITAAQFLQRFVGDTPWAHLDIAGAAWKDSSNDPRQPTWATGFGARLMNQWVADNHEG